MITSKRSKRTSSRKRKTADKLRLPSSADLSLARQRHLASLEDDNYAAEAEAAALADEPEYDPDAGSEDEAFKRKSKRTTKRLRSGRRTGKKRKEGIEKWNKGLLQAVEEEEKEERIECLVRWGDIQAGKGSRPGRKLCSVCGYHANYTCTLCAARFCSVRCGDIHKETRCLKFMV